MNRKIAFFALIFVFACSLVSCSPKSTCPRKSAKVRAESKICTQASKAGITFDKYQAGTLPEGFSTAMTHGGQPGNWQIVDDKGTKVLAQTSTDSTEDRYPLCIYDNSNFENGYVAVDFLTVSGKVDQAAGLVARYRDNNNYYITRANALENNVRLYKVEAGKRVQLASANLKVTPDRCHNLKFALAGSQLKVFYDSKPVLEATDGTFTDPGQVGLWTKADSVTYFNNLVIQIEK